jgi:sugar phosphate isomerase/epimerase
MKFSFLFYEPILSLAELDRRMERLKSLGYDGIELSASYPFPYAPEEVLPLSEKHRLPVVSMLSGWSYGNEQLCLASRSAEVRARAVSRLIDYAVYTAKLGSVLVVGLMQGLRSDEPDETAAQERIAAGLAAVAKAAEKCGATIVLEPVNHLQVGFNHTAAAASSLVKKIGSPALTYMLDTIHLNIEERSVLGTIRDHGSRIRHFHLCETNGGLYGTGNLDFPAVLKTLRETGYSHYASVKIYRGAAWEQAASEAIGFLKANG